MDQLDKRMNQQTLDFYKRSCELLAKYNESTDTVADVIKGYEEIILRLEYKLNEVAQ